MPGNLDRESGALTVPTVSEDPGSLQLLSFFFFSIKADCHVSASFRCVWSLGSLTTLRSPTNGP